MKYDFTSIPDRHGKDAMAVDGLGTWGPAAPKEGFDAIPMWVADMNFATPKCVTDTMIDRLEHPYFGYFSPRDELFDCIINWQSIRNGAKANKEDIDFDSGVLGGVTAALNVLCSRGDNVFVYSPTYIGFSGVFSNNGYHPVLSELVKDENGVWRMDFEDTEAKIRDNNIHAAVFCSPHNPTGRVWEQWELERFSEICEKYDVKVISDEIWSDIIMPGFRHIPTQSATEYLHGNTVSFYSPSKTFSLAGFSESYRICYNKTLRDRIRKEASLSHYNNLNLASMYSNIGAYTKEGMEWTDELREVLNENVGLMCGYLDTVKGLSFARPQGTYLIYVDCSGYCERTCQTLDELLKKCWDKGVALQDGRGFHGKCHIRMNLALPESMVLEAVQRLKKYVFTE